MHKISHCQNLQEVCNGVELNYYTLIKQKQNTLYS